MISLHDLLTRLKVFERRELVFRFPYIQCLLIDNRFQAYEDDDREEVVASWTQLTSAALRDIATRSLLVIRCFTPDEFTAEFGERGLSERGSHWLGQLIRITEQDELPPVPKATIQTIHFYGFKGGQARSTLLAMLATVLADDGWRVLVIDADIEAPSLDVIFGKTVDAPEQSLVGIAGGRTAIEPQTVKLVTPRSGSVDFIPCRPSPNEFDLDTAALALRTALDPEILSNAAAKIEVMAKAKQYDVILVDHRTGLAPSVLPWVVNLPGPTVFCCKMDNQWRSAKEFVSLLFSLAPERPGVIASWQPDDEVERDYRRRSRAQANELLELIAEFTEIDSSVAGDQVDISIEEVADHWLIFPYEREFRTERLPNLGLLSALYGARLTELRRLLDLSISPRSYSEKAAKTLSISGAKDEGWLIQTEPLRWLLHPNSRYSYVFGRKGTGKTRLARELRRAGIGETLLVAPEDMDGFGIKASDELIRDKARQYDDDPESFWWSLVLAGCQEGETNSSALAERWRALGNIRGEFKSDILKAFQQRKTRRSFLLDGLEIAFNPLTIRKFIEGIFRVLNTLQNDSQLSEVLHVKLFLRTDLAESAVENIAQQVENRLISLSWDTQNFFNFLLSRIAGHQWFAERFPEPIALIREKQSEIERGDLSEQECLEFLLKIFPDQLRRANILTSTFFKTYFADCATVGDQNGQYYPRVVHEFLEAIVKGGEPESLFRGDKMDTAVRINPALVELAHEVAAKKFLKDVADELGYLLALDSDTDRNKKLVSQLLESLRGKITPFSFKSLVSELSVTMSLNSSAIEDALRRMMQVGIFQDIGDETGRWRAGQLFKSSLGMKYYRVGRKRRAAG